MGPSPSNTPRLPVINASVKIIIPLAPASLDEPLQRARAPAPRFRGTRWNWCVTAEPPGMNRSVEFQGKGAGRSRITTCRQVELSLWPVALRNVAHLWARGRASVAPARLPVSAHTGVEAALRQESSSLRDAAAAPPNRTSGFGAMWRWLEERWSADTDTIIDTLRVDLALLPSV